MADPNLPSGGAPGGPPPSAGGGVLNKKLWGLPTWGWIAIAAAGGVVAFMWLQSRKKNSDTSSTDTSSTDDTGLAGEHDQDLYATIRDLQGQVSVPATGGDTTTTPTATTPAAVTGLKAARVSTDTIWLTWNGSVGARGYDVQWTDAQNHTGNGTSLLPGYVMAGLPRGEKYMIKVRAKHDLAPLGTGTDGEWTSPIQVTTHKV